MAQALVGSPGTRAASVSRPPAAATAPKAPPPAPKYGSVEELPDLPRYSEAEGQPRPVYEERPPVVTPVARRSGSDATWMRNAIAFQDDRSRPLIVIVIDDMGLDRPRSRRVLDLPVRNDAKLDLIEPLDLAVVERAVAKLMSDPSLNLAVNQQTRPRVPPSLAPRERWSPAPTPGTCCGGSRCTVTIDFAWISPTVHQHPM